jgi:hypothetical protein
MKTYAISYTTEVLGLTIDQAEMILHAEIEVEALALLEGELNLTRDIQLMVRSVKKIY